MDLDYGVVDKFVLIVTYVVKLNDTSLNRMYPLYFTLTNKMGGNYITQKKKQFAGNF